LTFVYNDITNENIALPIRGIDNISIDWGDDNNTAIQNFTTGEHPTHKYTYTENKQVTIKVTGGSFTHFGNDTWDALSGIDKLVKVSSWGNYTFTSMNRAFLGATNLTYVPNTIPSGVTNMSFMFYDATAFNGNIDGWDTSEVTDMNSMFAGATNFTGNIGDWITSEVKYMNSMFFNATFNGDISKWITSNVVNMSGMFLNAKIFNSNISRWNTSNVVNMSGMFYNATDFNQDINTKTDGSWNTSKVKYMNAMFYGATKFNQNIGSWITSEVTNMSYMFFGATKFNQNIGGWNIGKVNNINSMFGGDSNETRPILSVENYSAILIGWANKTNTPNNLSFTAVTNRNTGTAQYNSSAKTAYNSLSNKGWKFIPDPKPEQFTNNELMSNIKKIEG
jgi:surface protein